MKNAAALMCTDLPAPDNGQISYSTDTISPYDFGTEVTYTCNTGFGISSGNRTRTCGGLDINTEGVWNGVAVTCDREFTLLLILLTQINFITLRVALSSCL